MKKLTFIDVCAGIGGFSLGFERAGMTCVAQIEIDEFCLKILNKHWSHVPKVKDIRDAGKHNLPPVDVICAGIPCQPYSIAGKQLGKEDDRALWSELLRLVREIRPTWLVLENVAHFVNIQLDQTLSDLESEGYQAITTVLPACAFNADHRRDRVFVIAHTNRLGHAGRCKENGYHPIQKRVETNFANNGNGLWGKNNGCHVPPTSHPHSQRIQGQGTQAVQGQQALPWGKDIRSISDWRKRPDLPSPLVCGGDNGLPHRVDRVKALGNAIIPQATYHIAKLIIQATKEATHVH